MKTVLIIIGLLVLASVGLIVWLKYKDSHNESDEQPSEPVSNQEPTTEPPKEEEPVSVSEKPTEPKFKVGDYVVNCDGKVLKIESFSENCYSLISIGGSAHIYVDKELFFKNYHLWTIQDAKDGDIIAKDNGNIIIVRRVEIGEGYQKIFMYGDYSEMDNRFFADDGCGFYGPKIGVFYPATIEQCELLFSKMAEVGYTWDADTKTLSKIEEPETTNEPVVEEPKDENTSEFEKVIEYFSQVVPIGEKTKNYLKTLWTDLDIDCEEFFPIVYDYYGNNENEYALGQFNAWLYGLALAELVPEKRQQIIQMAYDYKVKGVDQPTYGYTFETDPNVTRILASTVYSITRNPEIIPELRKELGSDMVTYKNDVSELFIDLTKFIPTAPFPFLDAYTYRPNGLPVNATETADVDQEIYKHICQYYNLDTKDTEKRQRTIQAIADKEYKKPHLFGKTRTVVDPKYGEMTFYPVFGKHNIGVEIDPNGKIAELCYSIGRICTDGRKSLLDKEYGRRRPGQGESDPSANADPKQRALCNHTIEENDGHSTGYYEKNGDYVNVDTGQVIDDYDTYCQGLLYANSYPSGHSDLIMAVGMVLMMIMPDKADLILKALNEFANSRTICRYHWTSDTIHGRIAGSTMVPVLAACTNIEFDKKLKEAREEYLNPKPQPTEKVNLSLAYSIGGYGSCHVDAGEPQMIHCCTKQCTKERHPSITLNQKVKFTIEGGVTTDDGKTSGVWEANKAYGLKCSAVKEDKYAYITMRNENGVRIAKYRLSLDGTHDDGAGEY